MNQYDIKSIQRVEAFLTHYKLETTRTPNRYDTFDLVKGDEIGIEVKGRTIPFGRYPTMLCDLLKHDDAAKLVKEGVVRMALLFSVYTDGTIGVANLLGEGRAVKRWAPTTTNMGVPIWGYKDCWEIRPRFRIDAENRIHDLLKVEG